MLYSTFGSDNIISQLLVEAVLGQATPQENCTRHIVSGNIVVNQGQFPSSTPPPEANRQLDYESDGVDTASDPSLSTQSSPHLRTVISLEFSEAHSNLEAINRTDPSNSTISVMMDKINAGTGGGYFGRGTVRTEVW